MRFTFQTARRMSISAVFLLLISQTPLAQAKDATRFALPITLPDPHVTVKMENTTLRTALQQVLKGAGVNFSLHPDVPFNDVTVDLKEQPLSVVLKSLFKFSSRPLRYHLWNNIYRIETVPNPDVKPEPRADFGNRHIAMGLDRVPLRTVLILILEQFSKGGHISARLSQIGQRTPVTIHTDQPFEVVLESLRKVTGVPFQYIAEGRTLNFLLLDEKWKSRPFFEGGEAAPGEPRVTVDMTEVPTPMVLRLLLRQVKAAYDEDEVQRRLANAKVSIRLVDVPLRRALTEIGQASSIPFTYKKEKDSYRFIPVKGSGNTNKAP